MAAKALPVGLSLRTTVPIMHRDNMADFGAAIMEGHAQQRPLAGGTIKLRLPRQQIRGGGGALKFELGGGNRTPNSWGCDPPEDPI